MLMFNFHIVFSLELIALAFGAAILIWSKAHQSIGTSLATIIGYLIIILSVLNIVCTSYWAIKYGYAGYFNKPYPMMMQSLMRQGQMMSGKNMPIMQCPMMMNQGGQNQMMPMADQKMMKQGMQNQMMPMSNQMETKQMPGSMMQNQMNNASMKQGTAVETQKPLSN